MNMTKTVWKMLLAQAVAWVQSNKVPLTVGAVVAGLAVAVVL